MKMIAGLTAEEGLGASSHLFSSQGSVSLVLSLSPSTLGHFIQLPCQQGPGSALAPCDRQGDCGERGGDLSQVTQEGEHYGSTHPASQTLNLWLLCLSFL